MDRDATLHEIEQRVLWLATAVVHHANRVRPNRSGRSPARGTGVGAGHVASRRAAAEPCHHLGLSRTRARRWVADRSQFVEPRFQL